MKKILLSVTLFTFLYSSNEYITSIKYNDVDRIEELNSGYENININEVDEETHLTPLQYAAFYKPQLISELLNSYDIDINKTSAFNSKTPLNILLDSVKSENDENKIKAIIELINYKYNQDNKNWDIFFQKDSSDKLDPIQKMIIKKLYIIIYYIYQNNILNNVNKYIKFSINYEPGMAFYFKKTNNSSVYKKALEKLIKNDKLYILKSLYNDNKLNGFYTDIFYFSIKYKKKDILSFISNKLGEEKSAVYIKLVKSKLNKNVSYKKETKHSNKYEKFEKYELLKRKVKEYELKETNLLQKMEIIKQREEMKRIKEQNKCEKKIYILNLKNKNKRDKEIEKLRNQCEIKLSNSDNNYEKIINNLKKDFNQALEKEKNKEKELNKILVNFKKKLNLLKQNIKDKKLKIDVLNKKLKDCEIKNRNILKKQSSESEYTDVFLLLLLLLSTSVIVYLFFFKLKKIKSKK